MRRRLPVALRSCSWDYGFVVRHLKRQVEKRLATWRKNGIFATSEKKPKKLSVSGLSLEEYYGFEYRLKVIFLLHFR